MAVRATLGDLRARLAAQGLSAEGCGSVELALAEALNNIVEHAYPADRPGEICLSVTMTRDRLCCRLRDRGAPLPGLAVPVGVRPDPAVARAALPEGGFGWYLIRDLTDALSYARQDGENILTLEFALGAL
jgi:serine/threonine-protein kinase RsbW